VAAQKTERLRARHSFGVNYEGEQITIEAGEIVRVGHPLLKQLGKAGVEEHFEPVTSFGRFDVEQATAAPGAKRGE
jgi:hypothetical protein